MISVQNRLPEPGKENRVSITPDNGEPIEGVLAYADNASQQGTFWNRSTAQLLQGDIRTYPVREGQSISAGDVVNVGREVLSGSEYPLGDLPIGAAVQINENGIPVNYLVVHQGNPDPELYDTSCDGTWLLRKDIAENQVWKSNNSNEYESSGIHSYLNNTWINRYDENIRSIIKQVKIPYRQDDGKGTDQSGSNGLSCKIFLLSSRETGFIYSGGSYDSPNDGSKLEYFISGYDTSAKQKRIARLNDSASHWWLRSPCVDNIYRVWSVDDNGSFTSSYTAESVLGVRPCIIMDSSVYIDGSPVYGPETVYKDVVAQDNVENVVYGNAVKYTSICKVTDEFSIGSCCYGNIIHLFTIINNSGEIGAAKTISDVSNSAYAEIQKLDNTKAIIQYKLGTNLCASIYTVSKTSISDGTRYDLLSAEFPKSRSIVTLTDSLAISIYNSSGMKCKPLPISGTTITTSGTAYPLSGNTGANYISACRLPDEGGNKRVCIFFADTGDGNKGKAVIATIDSSNAVTFGTVKTIENSAVTATACATDGNSIVFNTSDSLILTDLSLNTIDTETSTAGDVTNVSAYTYAFLGTNNNAMVIKTNGGTISKGEAYAINSGSNTNYPSLAATSENGVVAAYSDAGNSNYGTTTILTVEGNQIAGSFLDNSSDAIALADGTGGQSIPVGFGGYCECPGVTEGDTIDSSGVWAYSPDDGWLKIVDAQEKRVITGTFTTGQAGATNSVNLGFKPSVVMVYDYNNNTNASSIPGASGNQANTMNCIRIIATETGNTKLTDTGFDIILNVLKPLWYVAWR